MKLRTKLVIPFVVILLVLGLSTWLLTRSIVSKIMGHVYNLSKERVETQISQSSRSALETVELDIRRIEQKALVEALIFAGHPTVLEAYRLAHSGNIDDEADPVVRRARNLLKQAIRPVIPRYSQLAGNKELSLHFHLSNNRSFARVWRDGWQAQRKGEKLDISDDLSAFRRTVVQINQGDHRPIRGIEVGRGGFVIRGLVPVIDNDGKHYGSCEIYFSFNDILSALTTDKTRNFAFYMDARLLETATSMKDSQRFPVVNNQFVLSGASRPDLTSSLITAPFLGQARKQPFSETRRNFHLEGKPIRDFSGETVGVAVVVHDISPQLKLLAETKKSGEEAEMTLLWQIAIGVVVALVLVMFLFSLLLRLVIIRPLHQFLGFADTVSKGDLTAALDVRQQDEIGLLVEAFRKIVSAFSSLLEHISGDILQLSSSSNELGTISSQVRAGADLAAGKAQSVASATEESSANINTIAAASEEASTNLNETSAKIGSMNATINDIAQHAKRANSISDHAVELVSSASEKVDALGLAASEIDQVTEVIKSISSKTDLLALNATVEAARAGEAGKGFAVVANEIKALANRTAESTKEIQQKIKGIQESTGETVTEIKQIEEVISEMHDIIFSITASVEEQAATTGEISLNMNQATAGMNEIAQNIAQSSIVSSEIATDITSVSQATSDFSTSATRISESAEDLAAIARDLKKVISGFRTLKPDASVQAAGSGENAGITGKNVVPLMTWDNSFALQIPVVDEQHRRLLGLVNQLHAAMKLKKDSREIGSVLAGLSDYTTFHFSQEEKLMKQAGYQQLESHQKIHRDLVSRITEIRTKFDAGDSMVSMELMEFLKEWLTRHIKGTDKQYAAAVIQWQNSR